MRVDRRLVAPETNLRGIPEGKLLPGGRKAVQGLECGPWVPRTIRLTLTVPPALPEAGQPALAIVGIGVVAHEAVDVG